MSKEAKNNNFETDMNRLRDIVKLLEEGNLSLKDSLKYFEEGIGLYRNCTGILDKAEQKISLLVLNEDGTMDEQPFDVYEEE